MFGYPSSPLSLSPSPWVANQFGQGPLLHILSSAINKEACNLPNSSTKTKSDSSKETMAEPYIEQVEYLDVLTKTGKKTGVSKPRHVPSFLSISGLSGRCPSRWGLP
ncbi:hypothetical protein Gotur_025369 [Gossypium turneri]